MNRRDFLVLLAATACGPKPVPRTHRVATGSATPPVDAPHFVDNWIKLTQLHPNRLIARGDLVARILDDQLVFVDAKTLATVGHADATYYDACVLDGALVAFTHPHNAACELDIFEKAVLTRSVPVPDCTGYESRVVPSGPSSLYISRGLEPLINYDLKGTLAERGKLSLVKPQDYKIDQMLSLGDGHVVTPDGRKLKIYGDGVADELQAVDFVAHLCAGPPGRVWYSAYKDLDKNDLVDRVVLTPLSSKLIGGVLFSTPSEKTISVSPDRLVHMSSGADGGLALLTISTEKMYTWTVICLDPKGTERWRQTVTFAWDKDINPNEAFIALTPSSVIVEGGRQFGLIAWDAATGARR